MKKLAMTVFLLGLGFFSISTAAAIFDSLKELPMQNAGRVKPFDTFARESLELVYGKITYENRPAVEIVMTWLLQPSAWETQALVEIRHPMVKRALKLEEGKRYFSFQEILKSERLSLVFQELQSKRETKEKLDPYYQALQRLENQIFIFREVAAGRLIRLVPPADGQTWLALPELSKEQSDAFMEITRNFVHGLAVATGQEKTGTPQEAEAQLRASVEKFMGLARAANPDSYPEPRHLQLEALYNGLHPFWWAAWFYVGALCCLSLFWIAKKDFYSRMAWGFALAGLLFHVYGFGLRIYLSGRAPVTNMYETVIWVALGSVVFSMILEKIYKWRFILMAGSIVGAFCLFLADSAPAILDGSLQPLEPVLRSNFWLTIHVLTITISYAAFFLAFVLGDIGLVYCWRGEEKNSAKIKAVTLGVYRAIQIGVSFLAPGIILGGVWADYSWGRFWGWDPKETWALIALLGYIAVLHARIGGLLKNFGMLCASVLSFSLVIMAWYGVNFVLGAGLHSYGFGAGGVEYVMAFVVAHLVFVGLSTMNHRGHFKTLKN